MAEGRGGMNWKNLLELVSEPVNDHLRLRNAYLVVENRILRQQIPGRVQLSDSDRTALAEMTVLAVIGERKTQRQRPDDTRQVPMFT